jgi:hypothetical protein
MNRIWKSAGVSVVVAVALCVLSGCWSRAPLPSDQVQSTTIQEPSGTSYRAQGSINTQPSAAADVSSQPAVSPSTSAQTSSQSYHGGNVAPVDNSTSQWQRGPGRQQSVNVQSSASTQQSVTEPSGGQASYSGQIQTQPSASAQVQMRSDNIQPRVSEGPNSGGKWHAGYRPTSTAEPAASESSGWLRGYYNRQTVQEPSGSANWQYHTNGSVQLQQQPNQQQSQPVNSPTP